jgi:hypothetical protein
VLFELVWTGRKSTKPYNADILQSPQLSLRLPFGLKSAPEIYVQTTNDLFGDLPGVLVYFDDFLFMGETKEKLLNNLRQVCCVRCVFFCRLFSQELSPLKTCPN